MRLLSCLEVYAKATIQIILNLFNEFMNVSVCSDNLIVSMNCTIVWKSYVQCFIQTSRLWGGKLGWLKGTVI